MAFNRKYFNLFKYLFPKSKNFNLFIQKNITKFVEGLTAIPDDFRSYIDNIYFDLLPDTTRSIELWESQFGITGKKNGLTSRRLAVANRWSMKGGQSAKYLETSLRNAGFDVYVHENNPPVDPATFLIGDFIMVARGDNAYAGRSDAYAGKTTEGSLLVNGFISVATDERLYLANAGNGTYAGNQTAVAAYFTNFFIQDKQYIVPTNPDEFPFVFFIGGLATRNGNNELISIAKAEVEESRKDEFLKMILTIKPAQSWAGLIIEYVF
jgi:hypothetical protein